MSRQNDHFSHVRLRGCGSYQEQLGLVQFKLICGLLAVLRLLRVVHDGIVSVLVRHLCFCGAELP